MDQDKIGLESEAANNAAEAVLASIAAELSDHDNAPGDAGKPDEVPMEQGCALDGHRGQLSNNNCSISSLVGTNEHDRSNQVDDQPNTYFSIRQLDLSDLFENAAEPSYANDSEMSDDADSPLPRCSPRKNDYFEQKQVEPDPADLRIGRDPNRSDYYEDCLPTVSSEPYLSLSECYFSVRQINIAERLHYVAETYVDVAYVSVRHPDTVKPGGFYGDWSVILMRRIQDKLGLSLNHINEVRLALLTSNAPLEKPLSLADFTERMRSLVPLAVISELLYRPLLAPPLRRHSFYVTDHHLNIAPSRGHHDQSHYDLQPESSHSLRREFAMFDYCAGIDGNPVAPYQPTSSSNSLRNLQDSCSVDDCRLLHDSQGDLHAQMNPGTVRAAELEAAVTSNLNSSRFAMTQDDPVISSHPKVNCDVAEIQYQNRSRVVDQSKTSRPAKSRKKHHWRKESSFESVKSKRHKSRYSGSSRRQECQKVSRKSRKRRLRRDIDVEKELVNYVRERSNVRSYSPLSTCSTISDALSTPPMRRRLDVQAPNAKRCRQTSSKSIEEVSVCESPDKSNSRSTHGEFSGHSLGKQSKPKAGRSRRSKMVTQSAFVMTKHSNSWRNGLSETCSEGRASSASKSAHERSRSRNPESASSQKYFDPQVFVGRFIETHNKMAEAERSDLKMVLFKLRQSDKLWKSGSAFSEPYQLTETSSGGQTFVCTFCTPRKNYEGRGLSINTAILNCIGEACDSPEISTLRSFAKKSGFATFEVTRRLPSRKTVGSKLGRLWKVINDDFLLNPSPYVYHESSMLDSEASIVGIISDAIWKVYASESTSITGPICSDFGFMDNQDHMRIGSHFSVCGAALSLLASYFDIMEITKLLDDLSLIIPSRCPFGTDFVDDLVIARQNLISDLLFSSSRIYTRTVSELSVTNEYSEAIESIVEDPRLYHNAIKILVKSHPTLSERDAFCQSILPLVGARRRMAKRLISEVTQRIADRAKCGPSPSNAVVSFLCRPEHGNSLCKNMNRLSHSRYVAELLYSLLDFNLEEHKHPQAFENLYRFFPEVMLMSTQDQAEEAFTQKTALKALLGNTDRPLSYDKADCTSGSLVHGALIRHRLSILQCYITTRPMSPMSAVVQEHHDIFGYVLYLMAVDGLFGVICKLFESIDSVQLQEMNKWFYRFFDSIIEDANTLPPLNPDLAIPPLHLSPQLMVSPPIAFDRGRIPSRGEQRIPYLMSPSSPILISPQQELHQDCRQRSYNLKKKRTRWSDKSLVQVGTATNSGRLSQTTGNAGRRSEVRQDAEGSSRSSAQLPARNAYPGISADNNVQSQNSSVVESPPTTIANTQSWIEVPARYACVRSNSSTTVQRQSSIVASSVTINTQSSASADLTVSGACPGNEHGGAVQTQIVIEPTAAQSKESQKDAASQNQNSDQQTIASDDEIVYLETKNQVEERAKQAVLIDLDDDEPSSEPTKMENSAPAGHVESH